MTTYELEAEVRAALIGNEELSAVLPNGANSVYHYVAPSTDPTRYPIIVFSPIEDTPALNGDNREVAHRLTIRIYVIAALKKFDADKRRFIAACDLIPGIMEDLGFSRLRTKPERDNGKLTYVFEFVKLALS